MRLATLRRSRNAPALPGLHAVARVASTRESTADFASRLAGGELAVLSHLDLDAESARLLVQSGVAAVVNTEPFLSGRYPARGAAVLADAGVLLLDAVGTDVLRAVRDGDRVRLDGEHLHRGDDIVATGAMLTVDRVHAAMARARSGLVLQLEAFSANTAEHLRRDHDLFLDGEGVPAVGTALAERPVLVVCDGPHAAADLARLKRWIRDAEPVIVGVGIGLDAVRAAGLRPHLFVGNPEHVAEPSLRRGIEAVVRCDRDAPPSGLDRAQALGARAVVFHVPVPDEDAALLIVDAAGPAYVVLAGSRTSVADFVDRSRPGMAGSFLARLRMGNRILDAATMASVHRAPARTWPLWLLALLLLAAATAVVVLAGDVTAVGEWRDTGVERLTDLWDDVR
jgi:uncharacterized membrane-anchored protein